MPSHPSFAINGRFLTQGVTGVQRYAREITASIDALLGEGDKVARLYVPAGAKSVPQYRKLELHQTKGASGHVWEQTVLPRLSSDFMLNFCNLGPAFRANQAVCIHDANIFNMPDAYSLQFRLVYRTLLPLLARRSAVITTVSEASARDLTRYLPLDRRRIIVLPNGHEHAFRWDKARSTIFEQHTLDRPFVLLLGSRALHKNMQLIFGLAADLDRLGLDIVVTGGKAGIFSQYGTVTTAPNLRWLGFVSDDDLAALMGRALCLVFPSFTEGFGLPIVEAMALGCPVISSDRSCMPEICGDAALMAPPDQPEIWLRQIQALLGSVDLRLDLAARGKERVKFFSWQRSARGYLALIQKEIG